MWLAGRLRMPRPNVTAPINLKDYFDKGQLWSEWLSAAENPANAETMRRLYQAVELPTALSNLMRTMKRAVHVLAMAEDWCGDVVQHTPVLARLADTTPL